MADRELGHYEMVLRAGPKFPEVMVDVEYFDLHGHQVGTYGEGFIAFCCTWKDIATAVRTGAKGLGLDHDPVRNVSPMVDLS